MAVINKLKILHIYSGELAPIDSKSQCDTLLFSCDISTLTASKGYKNSITTRKIVYKQGGALKNFRRNSVRLESWTSCLIGCSRITSARSV
jgi:hypothetical protein